MPATPRKISNPNIDAYLERIAKENDKRPHGAVEGNWVWHTEKCCRRVWRPRTWGCVKRAQKDS